MEASRRGVDAHADGRLLGAAHVDLRHAVDLRDALGDDRVGRIVEGARRQDLGGHRQDQNRRGRGIVFAECRHLRQVAGKVGGSGVERGLHVARGAVDGAAQVELDGDARRALRAHRGQLGHAGDLAEAALERRGDGGRHRLGIGAGPARLHAQRREIDGRQARDRQMEIGGSAQQEEAGGQKRRSDGPQDEGGREAHGSTRPLRWRAPAAHRLARAPTKRAFRRSMAR